MSFDSYQKPIDSRWIIIVSCLGLSKTTLVDFASVLDDGKLDYSNGIDTNDNSHSPLLSQY